MRQQVKQIKQMVVWAAAELFRADVARQKIAGGRVEGGPGSSSFFQRLLFPSITTLVLLLQQQHQKWSV